MDYSKAVLLVRDEYISDDAFMIPQNEFLKIKEHTHFIEQKFNKYILHYIEAVKKNDVNVLRAYKFSTLQNYHRELGLLSI